MNAVESNLEVDVGMEIEFYVFFFFFFLNLILFNSIFRESSFFIIEIQFL